jgi:hypothetical protein
MKYTLLLLIIIVSIAGNARAQFGIEVGGSYNIQSGTFTAPCGCTMANGNGFGYFAGAQFNLISLAGFSVGVEPAYEVQQFTSEEVTPDSLQPVANGDNEQVTLPYLTLSPYLRYTFPVGFFLQVAPGFKYLLTPSFEHTGADDGNISPTASMNVRAQRYDGKISIGYTIGLGSLSFSPTLSAAFPFTSVSEIEANGWHVTTIYGSVIVGL